MIAGFRGQREWRAGGLMDLEPARFATDLQSDEHGEARPRSQRFARRLRSPCREAAGCRQHRDLYGTDDGTRGFRVCSFNMAILSFRGVESCQWHPTGRGEPAMCVLSIAPE